MLAAPPTGDGRISLLDAQRRTRHKADSSAQQQQQGGGGSAERLSWRAGRTPFHAGAGSRFGRPGGALGLGLGGEQAVAASPLALGQPGAALAAAAAERPKGTTDTARRILATLESLDQAVAAKGKGPAGAEEEAAPAAPAPPPTETLGFAGGRAAGSAQGRGRRVASAPAESCLPAAEPRAAALLPTLCTRATARCPSRAMSRLHCCAAAGMAPGDKPRVTFGGVSFAPTSLAPAAAANEAGPSQQQQQRQRRQEEGAAAAKDKENEKGAAAQAPAAGGWGDAFLSANRKAAEAAAAAAKKEAGTAAGGRPQGWCSARTVPAVHIHGGRHAAGCRPD